MSWSAKRPFSTGPPMKPSRIRSTYQVIQMLKHIRGERDFHPLTGHPDDMERALEGTLEEVKERKVRITLFEMRPEHTYKEIAEALGVTVRSLQYMRERYGLP